MTRGSYPHPVLDASDDVGSDFEAVNFVVQPSHEDIRLVWEIRSDDPDLPGMLERGDVRHSIRWTCTATISTEECEPRIIGRTSNGLTLEAWIDQQRVRGAVDVELRVVAAGSIDGFAWANQHADYDGATFDISVGDVIADGGDVTFHATKLYDPLDPPVGSCFEFHENPEIRKGIRVDVSRDDVVVVEMGPASWQHFVSLVTSPTVQIGTVVLPALMETLAFIRQTETGTGTENLDDCAWYRTIRDLVDEHGGLDRPILELAQVILAHPLDATLEAVVAQETDT